MIQNAQLAMKRCRAVRGCKEFLKICERIGLICAKCAKQSAYGGTGGTHFEDEPRIDISWFISLNCGQVSLLSLLSNARHWNK